MFLIFRLRFSVGPLLTSGWSKRAHSSARQACRVRPRRASSPNRADAQVRDQIGGALAGQIGVVELVEAHEVLGDGPGQGDLAVGSPAISPACNRAFALVESRQPRCPPGAQVGDAGGELGRMRRGSAQVGGLVDPDRGHIGEPGRIVRYRVAAIDDLGHHRPPHHPQRRRGP